MTYNITRFSEMESIPLEISFSRLVDASGIESTFFAACEL